MTEQSTPAPTRAFTPLKHAHAIHFKWGEGGGYGDMDRTDVQKKNDCIGCVG